MELPSKEELGKLPRRAMIAFAGRCARRVQPLYKHFWADAPQREVDWLHRAIELVEFSAESPVAMRDLGDAARGIEYPVGYSGTSPAADAAHALFVSARASVAAAAAASDATRATTTATAATAAADLFGTARGAAVDAMHRDYELLKAAAEREKWTDETPVPPEFFGPIWPDGEPEGWPAKSEDNRESRRKMVLQIAVPEDTPDEELDATVAALIEAASAMHAAHGGSGLVVNDKRVYNPADVPVEVD